MSINDLLIMELDVEAPPTRKALERVPLTPAFAPHAKSMPIGKLAPHVAQLPGLGLAIVTSPRLDIGAKGWDPPAFEPAALVSTFDGLVGKLRSAIGSLPEAAWNEPWQMLWGEKVIFEGPRFLAYRRMFMNHLVHHRAQLGTYLRASGVPVPATYGPSADEGLA